MSAPWTTAALQLIGPHAVSIAVCAARLLPVAFLCPLLGGTAAPATVRLALTLSLAGSLHLVGGVNVPAGGGGAWEVIGWAIRETLLGTAIGLLSALPFDAARMGGRFIDLFRGSSAEAALPMSGTRESATGDGLYQLLVALVATGGVFPLVLGGLWRSFSWAPLGTGGVSEDLAVSAARLVCGAMATGLAIGAPIAAGALAVDCLLGLISRAAPQLSLQELGAPVKILGGGAVLWMGLGVMSERLLSFVDPGARLLEAAIRGTP